MLAYNLAPCVLLGRLLISTNVPFACDLTGILHHQFVVNFGQHPAHVQELKRLFAHQALADLSRAAMLKLAGD